jgi:hypothetical protein
MLVASEVGIVFLIGSGDKDADLLVLEGHWDGEQEHTLVSFCTIRSGVGSHRVTVKDLSFQSPVTFLRLERLVQCLYR